MSVLLQEAERHDLRPPDAKRRKRSLEGILVTKEDGTLKIINPKDSHKELGVEPHTLRFTNRFVYNDGQVWPLKASNAMDIMAVKM